MFLVPGYSVQRSSDGVRTSNDNSVAGIVCVHRVRRVDTGRDPGGACLTGARQITDEAVRDEHDVVAGEGEVLDAVRGRRRWGGCGG